MISYQASLISYTNASPIDNINAFEYKIKIPPCSVAKITNSAHIDAPHTLKYSELMQVQTDFSLSIEDCKLEYTCMQSESGIDLCDYTSMDQSTGVLTLFFTDFDIVPPNSYKIEI